jgi:membrane-bound lytic murein transglycosylase D
MKPACPLLPLALATLLAACAGVPSQTIHRPTVAAPTVPATALDNMVATPADMPVAPVATPDVWEQLRGSFAMPDCDADPAVLVWAKRYTRHPQRFEEQLSAVMPQLVYVQQVAAQYDIPGEFALLPWVESHFKPVSGRKNRPAGMWQIMPATANAMGLRVDGRYDGRLDVPASATAVMKLLKQYHDQFHDWRVADYAYNAGAYATNQMIQQRGTPADVPVIPHWPAKNPTREHLTKLLAMACIVRAPERFGVNLPTLPSGQHLVQVPISRSMPLAQAADHAGMPLDLLKNTNAAFRTNMIDAGATSYLLLPANHVEQFQLALLGNASAGNPPPLSPIDTAAMPPAPAPTEPAATNKTHTVKPGDNLWQIAHSYAVDVAQLQRWNHLQEQILKPGQVLKVSGTN